MDRNASRRTAAAEGVGSAGAPSDPATEAAKAPPPKPRRSKASQAKTDAVKTSAPQDADAAESAAKSDAKPAVAKAESKPGPKAEAKPEPKAEAKPEPKVEAKVEAKAEAKPQAKAEKSEAKPAAKEQPKAEAKPDAKAGPANPFLTADVETFASNMAQLWEASGKAMSAYVLPRQAGQKKSNNADVVEVARTLGQVFERWASDPHRVAEANRAFTTGFFDLWAGTLKRLSGEKVEPTILADPKDARFKDPEWSEHPVFDFLKQAYLHTAHWADKMVEDADDLDPALKHRAAFYVKAISNAISPSNFLPTNPELIRETIAQKGENLVRGMKMLAEDIEAGRGDLRIRQTDTSLFEVGRNIAVTPGKVIFRNDVMELIQYSPTTEEVRTRPLLIVPPWINKFYILDLNPEKSFIRWAVEQGLTVFCISWINPDGSQGDKSFDDYMADGIMKAVDVAREVTGEDQVDAVGYCVGGTLLSVTLAYMAAKGDKRIASATLLTTQVDFTHGGDLKVFISEDQIKAIEEKMAESGFLEGSSMANVFNMMRSNDLIWPYVVNNYLKGKSPFPFDLLYWNSDATRMPAANHSFYLRGCYLNNDLSGKRMEIKGETLDLSKVKIPVYELATREDHIAPPKSVFVGAQLFGGPVRFVLAGSGHIAGVVNPPAKIKYQHWIGKEPAGEIDDWIEGAEERPGSWWPDWRGWLAEQDPTMVAARTPGTDKYKPIEDAPGSYVKVKS